MKDRKKSKDSKQAVDPSQLQTTLQKQIGNYIAQLRTDLGWTQEELVARVPLSVTGKAMNVRTIGALENGLTDFQLSTLLRVLEPLKGNITTALQSYVPRTLIGDHWLKHQQLEIVLEKGTEKQKIMVETMLEHEALFVLNQPPTPPKTDESAKRE